MSNADFQDRLQRINAKARQQQPLAQGSALAGQLGTRKPRYGLLAIGGATMTLGLSAVKFANVNFEGITDSYGIGVVAGIALGGMAVLLIGASAILRAVFIKRTASAGAVSFQPKANVVRPRRQTSKRARVISSLVGFVFGFLSCFYLYMAAAARTIETEAAQNFAAAGFFPTFLLAIVSVLTGITGLILRGYALWRVPVYFFSGWLLTWAAIAISGINILEWKQFVAFLQ
ncbi:hypothetical protein [Ruegeria sp. HKCCD8929]|uniref:hypothetical protein n=1 Tax=Ruegeria sp. HKCCD8929 TaxID=2683006 RepID=UPI001489BAB8|nr:hypothetical protein [Ruegeria sp. HKCCD8929]